MSFLVTDNIGGGGGQEKCPVIFCMSVLKFSATSHAFRFAMQNKYISTAFS